MLEDIMCSRSLQVIEVSNSSQLSLGHLFKNTYATFQSVEMSPGSNGIIWLLKGQLLNFFLFGIH